MDRTHQQINLDTIKMRPSAYDRCNIHKYIKNGTTSHVKQDISGRPLTYPVFSFCKDAVCLDIGANKGIMIDQMLLDGSKKIYAFEAGNKLCQLLRTKYSGDDRVQVEEYAVSNESGILENVTWINAWMLADPSKVSLPVSPGACDIEGYNLVSIPKITIDEYCETHKIDNIGMVKIDVDGYELKVLQGARHTLTKNRPIMLIELSYYIDMVPDSSVKGFFDIIRELDYVFITRDGVICSYEDVEKEFPWHSSYDMILIPREKLNDANIAQHITGVY